MYLQPYRDKGGKVIPLNRGSRVALVTRGGYLIIEIHGPGPQVRRLVLTLDEMAALGELAGWHRADQWTSLPPTGAA
jgi:hypothetical protein